MTRRRPALGAVLAALFLVLATGACSTVPTSSATVQITASPIRPVQDVGIEPLPPETGASPEEVVRGFVDAAASTARGHPVARQFLAPQAARAWSDESGITILSPDYATVTTDSGVVALTGKVIGTVDPHGVFAVGSTQVYTRDFALQQVKGQWRITDPPDGLLILAPDFARLYHERDAYFIDPTGTRVVPDRRYVITGPSQPTALVARLLDGPSPALADGVRNPLAGAQLRRTVTVSSRAITVDLTGVGTPPVPVLSEICAQLVWTLDQLSYHSVEILIDGEPVELSGVPTIQTVDDWSSFDPEATAVGAVGHYLQAGALRTVDGKPAPGPAGTGAYGLVSAAVSADQHSGNLVGLAGVTGGGTPSLLVGAYGQALTPVLTATTLTAPTVAATRNEFWVVRDGTAVLRVTPGGAPQPVDAPGLSGLGRVQALRLSPDGVRAAVVVDGPTGPTLYMGIVVRSEDGGVALRDLSPITPSLSQVLDVAWTTSGSLMVLAGDANQGRVVPYTLGVDGYGLDSVATAGLPGQPTSLGAAPNRQPLVSAEGTIWLQAGGTWLTLHRGEEPVQGTAPFYPM